MQAAIEGLRLTVRKAGKQIYLATEAGAAIEAMRVIKLAFSTYSILNPGKILS